MISTEERVKTFSYELGLIKDPVIRKMIEELLADVPEYFFSIPASSGGNYHPAYANQKGGLVLHTKAAVRIANEMLSWEMFEKVAVYRDHIIGALILHDGMKNGLKGRQYTADEHPYLMYKHILEKYTHVEGKEGHAVVIADCVHSHMGQWNNWKRGDERPPMGCLPKPTKPAQKIVHMADCLAGRKMINFDFSAVGRQ